MKHFKHILLALALAAYPFQSTVYGCVDYDPDSDYFNLFDQLLLKEKGLHPYLLTLNYNGTYYSNEEVPDENLHAWIEFLKKNKLMQRLSEEEFREFVYSTPQNCYYQPNHKYTAMLNKSEVGNEVLAYFQYAKETEPYAQLSNDGEYWNPRRAKSPSEANYAVLRDKAINLYKTCRHDELKLRYGYQLVRLAHYMRDKDKEAIAMFNLYVKPLKQEHYIYYAALEQVAGALYNIGNLANANYLYCQVFDHSDNRKEAAYNSFKIQDEVSWEATLALCKTPRTQAALYAIRGHNTFSNEMEEVDNILRVCPDSPYMRLLAIRYINKVERAVLDKYHNEKRPLLQPSPELLEEFGQTKGIIRKIMENPKAGNRDFWMVYLAHLSFLCRGYQQAENILNALQTSDPALLKQASRTRFCLYLTQLTGIGEQEEKKIDGYMKESDADVDFIKEIVGHLYKQQGDYGKSFGTHYAISYLQANPDQLIINSLIGDNEKKNNQEALNQLYELKGTYFLRVGNYKEAINWYARVPDSYCTMDSIYDNESEMTVPLRPDQFNGYSGISPLLFSNGFKRLFSVPAASQLTDKLYTQYNYLNKYQNKATLTQALIELENESRSNNDKGHRAAYLLANYYYNISPHGYYRNIPLYSSTNYYYSYYDGYKPNLDYRDITFPDFSKDYNYKNFWDVTLVLNYMKRALELYQRVADNTQDRELKARALFMASSCVMDLYAPNWYYVATYTDKDSDNLPSWYINEKLDASHHEEVNVYFRKLATDFNDTQFYREAVRECKYFEYYVRNEL